MSGESIGWPRAGLKERPRHSFGYWPTESMFVTAHENRSAAERPFIYRQSPPARIVDEHECTLEKPFPNS